MILYAQSYYINIKYNAYAVNMHLTKPEKIFELHSISYTLKDACECVCVCLMSMLLACRAD